MATRTFAVALLVLLTVSSAIAGRTLHNAQAKQASQAASKSQLFFGKGKGKQQVAPSYVVAQPSYVAAQPQYVVAAQPQYVVSQPMPVVASQPTVVATTYVAATAPSQVQYVQVPVPTPVPNPVPNPIYVPNPVPVPVPIPVPVPQKSQGKGIESLFGK